MGSQLWGDVRARGDEPAELGGLWFDWYLPAGDWAVPDSRAGVQVFMPGICANPRGAVHRARERHRLGRKLEESDQFVFVDDGQDRFVRFAYPGAE